MENYKDGGIVMRTSSARIVFILWILYSALDTPYAVAATPHEHRGIVIEEVPESSTLAKAGLRPGDIALAWGRAETPLPNSEPIGGQFESYFDWIETTIEQAPRGPLRLEVARAQQTLHVTVSPGDWAATVRPTLPKQAKQAYDRGREGILSGKLELGRHHWHEALTDELGWELRGWWLLRISEHWKQARNPMKAREFSQLALDAAKDPVSETVSRWSIGHALLEMGQAKLARETIEPTVEIWQASPGNELFHAQALQNLGMAEQGGGNVAQAQRHFERSLELTKRSAPDSLAEARILVHLSLLAASSGNLILCQQLSERALKIRQQLAPNSPLVASSLNNLGALAAMQGDLVQARQFFHKSIKLLRNAPKQAKGLAAGLNNIGVLSWNIGDLDSASKHIKESLKLSPPNSATAAMSINTLGVITHLRGDLDRAAEYYADARKSQEKINPSSVALANTLNNISILELNRGNLDSSREHLERSLEIHKRTAPESHQTAAALTNLGTIAQRSGDLEAATTHLTRALQIAQATRREGLGVADVLSNLATIARARGDLAGASQLLQRALSIRNALAPYTPHQSQTLYNLAIIHQDEGDIAKAIEYFESSLHILENQISKLGGPHELQANFRAKHLRYYRLTIEAMLKTEQHEQAFHTLERFRARTLLKQLAERDLVLTSDIPPETDRQRRLSRTRFDRTLRQLASLNIRENSNEIATIQERLERLREEANEIQAEIRSASPRLAALQFPEPLDVDATRAALDPGTLLLSFSLGEEESTLFAVSPEAPLQVTTLPIGEEELRRRVEGFRELVETTQPGSRRMAALQDAARDLYNTLLAPMAHHIASAERLLILPDGPLYYLPWAALRHPSGENGSAYLIEQLPVHVAVSATVYAELRQDRRSTDPETFQVAAFGDPLYPGSEDQVRHQDDAVLRSVAERGIFDWQPLPESRREVEALATLYPGAVHTYLGAEATEERVKALGRDTRIVHFATHGHVDERFPMNSFLALSIPEPTPAPDGDLEAGSDAPLPDSDPEDRDNGLLQVWEIYESLRLDADLVVLSACQSAIGEELRGEGLMGLTRAFHYAGARSVLASLWNVEDTATAELMVRFHRHLRQGLPKDEALRAAQLELIDGPVSIDGEEPLDATAPGAWAAFQLYGDWR